MGGGGGGSIPNPRAWDANSQGVLAILQFSWAITLAGLRVNQVNVGHAQAALEEDEFFIDLALEGKVFHHIPSLVLASASYRKEEFYQRRLHNILTDFLTMMPLKIKEMRHRADESARNAMMHEQEGIQFTVPMAGQHFPQLLLTVSSIYSSDRLGLGLSDVFWSSSELGDSGRHNYPAKQVALYKFVRLAGDLLMPPLFVPYIKMLTGLADTKNSAPHAFRLLKSPSSGSSTVSLDHFFQSLSQYLGNLGVVTPVGASDSIYRSYSHTKPITKGISPTEIAGLSAVLGLLTVLADR